jgi:hypothetical protein
VICVVNFAFLVVDTTQLDLEEINLFLRVVWHLLWFWALARFRVTFFFSYSWSNFLSIPWNFVIGFEKSILDLIRQWFFIDHTQSIITLKLCLYMSKPLLLILAHFFRLVELGLSANDLLGDWFLLFWRLSTG